MRGDLRVSTKYIDWALVPSRWIERRFLIFTALRNPGYILLHLVAGPPLAAVVGITIGVLLELVGVPEGNDVLSEQELSTRVAQANRASGATGLRWGIVASFQGRTGRPL